MYFSKRNVRKILLEWVEACEKEISHNELLYLANECYTINMEYIREFPKRGTLFLYDDLFENSYRKFYELQ